jgi:hypothetical protein
VVRESDGAPRGGAVMRRRAAKNRGRTQPETLNTFLLRRAISGLRLGFRSPRDGTY